MSRFASTVLLVAALVGSAAGGPERANELFQQGRKLLTEQDDPAGACAKFKEAIALDPSGGGIMLNLGLCHEKLGKYRTALYWYRKAQARAIEGHAEDNERAAREHTIALAKLVATISIEMTGAARRGRVTIDNELISAEDYARVEIDAGPHVLVATSEGMRSIREDFTVEGKGGKKLVVTFVPGDNKVVVDPGKSRRLAATVVAIGGGALWAASGGLCWYEKSQWNKYEAAAGAGDPNAIAHTNHAHDVAATWGTGLFVAGTAALGTAAFLYFTAPSREVVDQTVWIPTVGAGGIGLAAARSF